MPTRSRAHQPHATPDWQDEIPKEGQKPLLKLIAEQLSQLPDWLRIFVTSRDEPLIKKELAKFEPKELRADEAKTRADVEIKLRTMARKYVKGERPAAKCHRLNCRPTPEHTSPTPLRIGR